VVSFEGQNSVLDDAHCFFFAAAVVGVVFAVAADGMARTEFVVCIQVKILQALQ